MSDEELEPGDYIKADDAKEVALNAVRKDRERRLEDVRRRIAYCEGHLDELQDLESTLEEQLEEVDNAEKSGDDGE